MGCKHSCGARPAARQHAARTGAGCASRGAEDLRRAYTRNCRALAHAAGYASIAAGFDASGRADSARKA
jgi:hypothetical protein